MICHTYPLVDVKVMIQARKQNLGDTQATLSSMGGNLTIPSAISLKKKKKKKKKKKTGSPRTKKKLQGGAPPVING